MSDDTDSAFPSPEWIGHHCEKCGHITFYEPVPCMPEQVVEAAEKRLGLASPANAYAKTAWEWGWRAERWDRELTDGLRKLEDD